MKFFGFVGYGTVCLCIYIVRYKKQEDNGQRWEKIQEDCTPVFEC